MDARTQAVENLRLAHDRGAIDLAAVVVDMLTPAGAIGEWDSETIEMVLGPAQDACDEAGLAWVGNTGDDGQAHAYWAAVAEASGMGHDYDPADYEG